jgi:hypothetical protein
MVLIEVRVNPSFVQASFEGKKYRANPEDLDRIKFEGRF